jgi:hypothetical protein
MGRSPQLIAIFRRHEPAGRLKMVSVKPGGSQRGCLFHADRSANDPSAHPE